MIRVLLAEVVSLSERLTDAASQLDISRKREADLQKLLEDAYNEAENQSNALRNKEDLEICKICMERKIDCVILDCGHLCICKNCAQYLVCPICPICRQHIARFKFFHLLLLLLRTTEERPKAETRGTWLH